jgi:hypothetical protein
MLLYGNPVRSACQVHTGSMLSGCDPDRLPDSSNPSGLCPHCARVSSFTLVQILPVVSDKSGTHYAAMAGGTERPAKKTMAVLRCQGCLDSTVVIQDRLTGGEPGDEKWAGVHWWPPPGIADLDPDVPEPVAESFAEGMRCLSANAPNGAAMLFRTAMTYIVHDKGSDAAKAKRELTDRIKQMVMDGDLNPDLGDWATQLRLLGNAGAHPDIYGEVTREEAGEVARLIKTLLDVLYAVPAMINRRRQARGMFSQNPASPATGKP